MKITEIMKIKMLLLCNYSPPSDGGYYSPLIFLLLFGTCYYYCV